MAINLTIPAVHAELSIRALEAGKHVYSEKPLAVNRKDAKRILDTAKRKKLRVGCAPDTFLGAGLQTCRKLVDDAWLGRVTSGTAFMMGRGPEGWHPNPFFFYEKGAGPMLDMGVYYITALVHLLGPVKSVAAITSRAYEERIATCDAHYGKAIPVSVPTHYAGALAFHSGPVVTMTISFDVIKHTNHNIELHGTSGSMQVPDPNTFGNPVRVFRAGAKEWLEVPHTHIYADNMRSVGAADMAAAIAEKRPHRCSGELAYHVLDVMHSFEESSNTGTHVELESCCDQPAPLSMEIISGQIA
jgi:predicted dehydrogenase